uniref:Uncharacterized protein n=1 Tax=Triticum urartu TaxID=4572 RepID=A0A8R7JX03_TRIUA
MPVLPLSVSPPRLHHCFCLLMLEKMIRVVGVGWWHPFLLPFFFVQ